MRTLDRSSWPGGYRLDMAIAAGFTGLAMAELRGKVPAAEVSTAIRNGMGAKDD